MLAPISPQERAQWLDALRGFALLGILLTNIVAFSGHAFLPPAAQAQLPWSAADGVLGYLVHALVEAKFYSLFSFLFGMGFAIQLQRAQERGGDFVGTFRRRMGWLLAFGLAHALLIWFGDILNFYAMMGFALLLFRKASPRALLAWALVFLTAPVWLYAAFLAFAPGGGALPAPPGGASAMQEIIDRYAHGSYPDIVHSNAMIYIFAWVRRITRFQLVRIFGMFLLGAWAGRVGLPWAREALRPLLKRWLVLGFAVGLPLNLAFAAIGGNDALLPATAKGLLSITMGSIGIPLLSLGYAAAFGLWWRTREDGMRNLFVSAGRMALSHYLAQSVVCIAVFYGIGAGLFQKTSIGLALLIALIVWLCLSLACRTWLSRHAQGPMEALWRRLSYGRVRDDRQAASTAA